MIHKNRFHMFCYSLLIFFSVCLSANASDNLEANDLFLNSIRAKGVNNGRFYSTFNYPAQAEEGGTTALTGIRRTKKNARIVLISGYYTNQDYETAFVYKGNLEGDGKFHELAYPSAPGRTVTVTALYGPNNGIGNHIQVVGNYATVENGTPPLGCLYQGPLDGSGKWTTVQPTSLLAPSDQLTGVICHSTMGGFIVGNYNTVLKPSIEDSQSFIYDIKREIFYPIVKANALGITAYGIWHNGGNSYTICGGFTGASLPQAENAYLVDWDSKTNRFKNWRSFSYANDPIKSLRTHFDGLNSDGHGGFYLTGIALGVASGSVDFGFFAHARKGASSARWALLQFPGGIGTTGNSVYKRVTIGVYTSIVDQTTNGYISAPVGREK